MSKMHSIPKHLLLVAVLGLSACGGDAAKKGDAKVDAKKTEVDAKKTEVDAKKADDVKPEVKPAALAFKKLDKLGLEIEVPADAEVSDSAGDAPGANVSSGDMTIMIATVTDVYPSDFAAAKKGIEGDPNKFKAFSKEAQTEGGWHLEYELTSMDGAPLYGVEVRKTIDGKGYQCGRNDRNVAVRDAVAKACLSLKKAG